MNNNLKYYEDLKITNLAHLAKTELQVGKTNKKIYKRIKTLVQELSENQGELINVDYNFESNVFEINVRNTTKNNSLMIRIDNFGLDENLVEIYYTNEHDTILLFENIFSFENDMISLMTLLLNSVRNYIVLY